MPKTTKHLAKHQFKKGAPSANPEGARKHNPAIIALGKLTVQTYREVIEVVLTGNLQSLKDMVDDPKTSALQVGIATAFIKAIKSGDYAVIERIAERIVGKIPDEINLNANSKLTLVDRVKSIDREALREAMKDLEHDV